jgi:hypothetical protein
LDGIRFFVLNITLHLVVSFVLFVRNREVDDFWSFNKNLFIRIITSGIYSGTLILGLNFALLAIDQLFNVEVDQRLYPEIAVSILGIFNTLFFLSGVPKLDELHEPLQYPKGLKNFTQFVLLPLVAIYLLILLAYESKILATFSLPKGWVSTLILVFSVLGILAMLLVYPLRNSEGNKWIKQLWKWYFWFLIPLIGLLFWAILYRVSLYGITVERYYVFILACWLSGITFYSIIKPHYHIRLIPISLAVVGLCSLYGPQSAGSVAKRSQEGRLRELLSIHHTRTLTRDERKDVTSIADYLFENYSSQSLISFFPKAFPSDSSYKTISVKEILASDSIKYTSRYDNDFDEDSYVNGVVKESFNSVPTSDYFWYGSIYRNSKLVIPVAQQGTRFSEMKLNLQADVITVTLNDEALQLNLAPIVKIAQRQSEFYTPEEFTVTTTNAHYHITFMVKSFNAVLHDSAEKAVVNNVDGALFVKRK